MVLNVKIWFQFPLNFQKHHTQAIKFEFEASEIEISVKEEKFHPHM